MKLIIPLFCTLAANAAVLKDCTLENVRTLGYLNDTLSSDTNSAIFLYPEQQIVKKTPLKPRIAQTPKAESFPQASRKRLIFGPFQLQPVASPHVKGAGGWKLDRHSDLFEETLGGICRNCMILGLRYDVTDGTGKKLLPKDEVYTHHMVLGSTGRRTPMTPLKASGTCMDGVALPDRAAGSPFPPSYESVPDPSKLGSFFANPPVIILNKGQEKNAINFMPLDQQKLKSGFWIGKNDTIMTSVEIVNYKSTAQDVYLTLDLEYLSFDTRPKNYFRTEFASLFGTPCGPINMCLPSDRLVTHESARFKVQKNLYLVNLNPHLHDGALNMKVHVNGKVACSAEAKYGQEGGMSVSGERWETISHYTACKPIELHLGDELKITSDFDLRQHKLRPDSADHDLSSEILAMAFIQFASAD